jgi:muramoyltetrapeptide carboxypeptidase
VEALIKPRSLKKGDLVGIVAPGSPLVEESQIEFIITWLDKLGLKVKLGKHVFRRHGDHAGTDRERLEDLQTLWTDAQTAAIFALRGGNSSVGLLPSIDFELLKRHPKIFMGFSDITGLLIPIHQKTGLVTFHGPTANAFFESAYTFHYFKKAVFKKEPLGLIVDPIPASSWQPQYPPPRVVIGEGQAKGRLIGGSLTLIRQLMGSPYEIETEGRLLFIEEVNEDPHCVDRMLTQLLLAGKLQKAAGILVGECVDCRPGASQRRRFSLNHNLETVLRDRLGKLGIPVVFGLRFGHGSEKFTLPLGVMATLECSHKEVRFRIDEGAVL